MLSGKLHVDTVIACFKKEVSDMAKAGNSLIDSWNPGFKKDLTDFLADTDAWVIAALKDAQNARDWKKIARLISIMETVHNISHSH